MKKMLLPLAVASIVGLQACNQQASEPAESAAQPAEIVLDNQAKRLSYGIALGLGQRMVTDQVPLDVDAFSAGMRDAASGATPKMTDEEITAEMNAFQSTAQAAAEAKAAEAGQANQIAGEAYLAQNATKEGVVITESGLQYEVMTAGEGAVPTAADTVEVHYTGTLIDGTVFDSSVQRGQPATFGVTQVIPGWTEVLQLMPVGSKYNVTIPSDLGYGAGGAGQVIGPNSVLVFEVELLSIQTPPAAEEAAGEAAE